MSRTRPRITEFETPAGALAELCEGFFEAGHEPTAFNSVEPESMPDAFRRLLVHEDHMTTQLEAYHGRPVELGVLEYRHEGDLYTRKILLTLEGTDHVVEFGIMRLDLRQIPESVGKQIIDRSAPLGAILIEHDLLRRIEPKWFLRFPGPQPQKEYFAEQDGAPVYGRIGMIHCNHEPAIELLEIVTEKRGPASE